MRIDLRASRVTMGYQLTESGNYRDFTVTEIGLPSPLGGYSIHALIGARRRGSVPAFEVVTQTSKEYGYAARSSSEATPNPRPKKQRFRSMLYGPMAWCVHIQWK